RARHALPCLAVPAHRQIGGAFSLYLMDGVEHDHALRDTRRIVTELSARARTAPDSKSRGACFGARTRIAPGSRPLATFDNVSRERLVGGAYALLANALTRVHLLVLLDNPLEIFTHLGNRFA